LIEFLDGREAQPAAMRRRYIELLEVLMVRHLNARFRGSRLGVLWSLLNPAIMTGVYTAIFSKALLVYYGGSVWHYAIAVFTGLIAINLFSGSTAQALHSIVGNGSLLNKIRLPLSIFPIAYVGSYLIQFAIGALPLLVIATAFFSRNVLNVLALALPLGALAVLCFGVALIVSVLYVYFRDLPYFYELIVFMLWITSPVFYPSEIVPAAVRHFLILNPLAQVLMSLRQIALSGDLPDLGLAARALAGALIVLAIGVIVVRATRYRLMEML
jgi:ABC-2 type transport system permease protein/lipopolysaccharide transport system permease protein